ncbi:MAG: hypothetical protein BWY63_02127 [Chloroflexi bacterium ADurb.Bin360]|nr:MAG: hypothetical protein BWY63_02127 [Chloroflexi bacterium ADurb.Bin360]
MIKQRSEKVPAAMQPIYESITALTNSFCEQHLNAECAVLCRELAAALARKRPSPLVRGAHNIWACGIVYALGTVNFLFDKSQTPHTTIDELCGAFGVSKSSGANKAKQIRDLFGMSQFDPDWCLPSKIDSNFRVWTLQLDGLIVDARYLPREIQEIAYAKGLIPYIPGDPEQQK